MPMDIEYSNDVFRKCNVLIAFDNIITYMVSIKKISSIVNELFVRGRQINISTAFITKSYTKLHTFFYYENFEQTRASTNRI